MAAKKSKKVWRIRYWRDRFEPDDSKRKGRRTPLQYVKWPIRGDNISADRQTLEAERRAILQRGDFDLLGIYATLLQIAGDRREFRGCFLDHRYRPASPRKIAEMIGYGMDAKRIEKALKNLASPTIGLVEQVDMEDIFDVYRDPDTKITTKIYLVDRLAVLADSDDFSQKTPRDPQTTKPPNDLKNEGVTYPPDSLAENGGKIPPNSADVTRNTDTTRTPADPSAAVAACGSVGNTDANTTRTGGNENADAPGDAHTPKNAHADAHTATTPKNAHQDADATIDAHADTGDAVPSADVSTPKNPPKNPQQPTTTTGGSGSGDKPGSTRRERPPGSAGDATVDDNDESDASDVSDESEKSHARTKRTRPAGSVGSGGYGGSGGRYDPTVTDPKDIPGVYTLDQVYASADLFAANIYVRLGFKPGPVRKMHSERAAFAMRWSECLDLFEQANLSDERIAEFGAARLGKASHLGEKNFGSTAAENEKARAKIWMSDTKERRDEFVDKHRPVLEVFG